jgi:hypothetical protein
MGSPWNETPLISLETWLASRFEEDLCGGLAG